MADEIGFKSKFITVVPSTPASVPNGSIFVDSTNSNQASFKDGSGSVVVVGAVSSSSLFIKEMQASTPIPINTPVAKLANGKIVAADSDEPLAQEYIGITLAEALAIDDLVNVLLPGANIVNALTGLGFAPGDEIFLDEGGGFTNDVSGFSGDNDSIIRVGIADCSSGVASGVADDLIAFTEIVARP